jgi:dTDP-4-dehydrorhamnose reductase
VTVERVAILGGAGQLGSALRSALRGREVVAPAHADVAVEDARALAALLDAARPQVLINCSAFHHVDTCERKPERAFTINALAVDRAAELCAQRGVGFATMSTDYVFDGTLGRAYREDDAVNPLTAYGASKAAGESLTRRHGERHWIFRTSGVFGTVGSSSKGYTLVDKVLRQAERGEPTRMVDDVVFSPSYAPHVARAIRELIDRGAYGTHHVTNGGACSWYAFVRTAFEKAGLADAPLEPTRYAALGNPTRRPAYSPLESQTLPRLGIAALPPWAVALDEYLAARAERLAGREA